MGPDTSKNGYCYSCHRRSYRGGYCDLHNRIIKSNEILPCMFVIENFVNGKAPLKEGMVLRSWDEVYKGSNDVTDKLVEVLSCAFDEGFKDFLKKVDKTDQGTLIEELFGSKEMYVDSPGDFHKDPDRYEYSIIYNYTANCCEADLLRLYGFWISNIKKCYEWTYPKRLKTPLKIKDGRVI